MTEKKGFFRRVFSFGQKDEPENDVPEQGPRNTAPDETSVTSETDTASVTGLGGTSHADEAAAVPDLAEDVTRHSDGDAPAATATPGVVMQDEATAADATPSVLAADPSPVLADEPAWLDPDAPEPEADFSWLEAGDGESHDSAVAEEGAAADVEHSSDHGAEASASTTAFDADLEEFEGEARGVDALPPSVTGTPPMAETPSRSDAVDDEPDFSFLDPDAPLPDEEEAEADFSWLEPEGASAESEDDAATISASAVVIGAAGIAAAGAAASPSAGASTGEAGWRLREAAAPAPAAPAARTTFLDRLREGLARSSNQLSGSITSLFTKRRLDDDTLQDFEDVLLQADLGVETALRITDRLSEGRFGKEITGDQVRTILADEVEATLRPVALPLELDLEKKPHVILVVGVNGTGKTTTIGKLTAKLTRGGLKVTLCAGDTFRAAAVEQLKIWGERTGSEVVAKAIGADAAGLAFEAYDRAVENESDVLIIDTAGRLQNKAELMAELEKIVRVLQRREPDAPHTVLQTLDATTGQNALSQVEIFRNVAGVNGLVMTKLDGTARGGILVAIAAKYRLPVYFIGVGEGIDDLEPFKARDFALAIAGKA